MDPSAGAQAQAAGTSYSGAAAIQLTSFFELAILFKYYACQYGQRESI